MLPTSSGQYLLNASSVTFTAVRYIIAMSNFGSLARCGKGWGVLLVIEPGRSQLLLASASIKHATKPTALRGQFYGLCARNRDGRQNC